MPSPDDEPLAVHRFTGRGLASRWAPLLLIAAIFGVLAVGFMALAASRSATDTLLPGLLFVAITLGCLAPVAYHFLRRVRRVELHPDRVVWEDAAGEHRVDWEDVEGVRRMERITNNWWYRGELTITLRDGRSVVFDQTLADFGGLADQMQRLTALHLLPRALAECSEAPVDFGPVRVGAEGIYHGGRLRYWDDIEYALSRGYLVIVPAEDEFGWTDRVEVVLADIPNLLVFVELMVAVGKPPVDAVLVIPRSDRARLTQQFR